MESAYSNGNVAKRPDVPSVLLVEDTDDVRNMYAFGLQHEGFEVVMAGSGGEALERLAERPYDVVVLDMMLSGMSGLDVLANYDVKAKHPQTKLVILSNIDTPRVVQRANRYKLDAYLVKSNYEPTALANYLRKLLGVAPANPPA